jgi:MYXO-CTERM domain-containing protein
MKALSVENIMVEARRYLGLVLCAGLAAVGCAQGDESRLDVGVAREAINGCEETVPATRFIDGIPAYAQCATTMNSAIYSNNGIDTATTSMGTGWVRTQYSGGYQCTELAHRYLYFKWNVKWIPNGNAGAWCDTMPPANSGVVQTMAPVHGDIMVLAPGSCGADATTGHVNVIDTVDAAKGKVVVVEQNGARRGTYNTTCGKCFLHVVANDGMNPGATITPPPAAGAGAAGTGAAAGAPSQAAGSAAPPDKRPAPQAGAAAPAPSMPSTTPPAKPTTPPVAPAAPAAAGSAAPAPAAMPSTMANAGSPAPITPVAATPEREPAEDGGCSVTTVGSSQSSGQWLLALAFGMFVARRRRTRR